ncbi:MAG TPA: hypothetical protein VFI96_05160 [Longimicrobiaceae bacterium]|nr:hypothetical protein [Longimicrobiaceae bacterium]
MPSTDTREPQDDPMEVARRFPADSPLHSVEDDVSGLLEYAQREYGRGMSGEAHFFWRCASRIAHAALRSPARRKTTEATREVVEAAFREALDLYHDASNDGSMFHPDACIEEPVERVMALFSPAERGEGEAPRCEKCDSRDIHTRYRKKGEYIDHGGYPDYERAREDCLRRYCRTCGDRWIDPLASPAPSASEPTDHDWPCAPSSAGGRDG